MKKTKNTRKGFRVLFTAVLLMLVLSTGSAFAATAKTGLKKENGKYYFYDSKGEKVKNKWKTVGKYTYYFGKNGAAYSAATPRDKSYNFKIYTIKGKKYGFDAKARRVSGVLISQKLKLYYFTKKGVYKAEKTKKLRKLVKTGRRPSNVIDLVQAGLGKAKKVKWSGAGESCDGWNGTDTFTDVSIVYPHFEIILVKNDNTGEMNLSYCYPTR